MNLLPALLRTRRFLPLFLTQFLGAFNDNLFRSALVVLIAYRSSATAAPMLVTLAAALFTVPFLLFSATAGQLADKIDRARLARRIKFAELAIMIVAGGGLMLQQDIHFLLFLLFCIGVQAAFFGTVKYALLPQHLRDDELVSGNAWIEAGTFLAILLGTIAGGLLILQPGGANWLCASMVACALAGYMASCFIPSAPPPVPLLRLRWNIVAESLRMINRDRKNPRVFFSILGISWFWLVGATFLSQFPSYTLGVWHADAGVVTLFLTMFSLGIVAGSLLCGRLLHNRITARYSPLALLGISLFTADLFLAGSAAPDSAGLLNVSGFLGMAAGWRVVFDLFAIAVCGGIYVVPLYAIMQHDSESQYRARTIASNNVLNALFMVLSATGTMLMLEQAFSIPQIFLTVAVANIPAALYIRRINTL